MLKDEALIKCGILYKKTEIIMETDIIIFYLGCMQLCTFGRPKNVTVCLGVVKVTLFIRMGVL